MDESPKRGLLAAYGRLLRPLIRILIRNGVSFIEFADVAKQAYVEVAERDFSIPKVPITDNRISALTGLRAEEVRQVGKRLADLREQASLSNLNKIVAILTGWHTDSDYTGPYGVPLEIQLNDSSEIDFSTLARRHAGDSVEPQVLLEEMVTAKVVRETERGWYRALTRYFIPEGSAPAGLEHLSRTLQDLVTTIEHNMMVRSSSEKMFERHVYTEDGIRSEDLPRFEAFARERALILLEEIDNWLSHLDKPAGNLADTERISTGLGIFHYIHRGDRDDFGPS